MLAYTRPPARTDSGGGEGESQDNPTGGGECHLFLAGNHMTTVAFEKDVFKSLACLAK